MNAKNIKKIGILTSGGDCGGLNAVVRAVTHRAIEKYKETIESSKDLKAYFSASASYHLARIYEKEKMYSDSRKYYKLCLKLKNHSYKRSFDIKAKSGLHRISQLENSF